MAHLFSNHPFENDREAEAVQFLQKHLPEEYILVNNIQLAKSRKVPEIDLLIITEKALIIAELKDWYGDISGNPQAGHLLVGPQQEHRSNPIAQVLKQAKSLAYYLRQEENGHYIFGDFRVASSLYVTPLLIFTHPVVNLNVESTAHVKLLRLDEAVAYLTNSALDNPRCPLKPEERMKLVQLLLNERQPLEQTTLLEIPSPEVSLAPQTLETTPLPIEKPKVTIPPIIFQSVAPRTFGATSADPSPPVPERPFAKKSHWTTIKQIGRMLTSMPDIVEDKVQGIVEKPGTEKRLSRSLMIKKLERKMEDNLYVFSQATIAPNHYLVGMASIDYEYYLVVQQRLCEDLMQHVKEVTRTRDYRLEGEMVIEISEMPELLPGQCQVIAHIEAENQIEQAGAFLELLGETRDRYVLTKSITTIGRAQENDVCLDVFDTRRITSRRHAQVKLVGNEYQMVDLNSSQGTYVNGQRINGQGQILQTGDTIILGPIQRRNPLRPMEGSVAFVFQQ